MHKKNSIQFYNIKAFTTLLYQTTTRNLCFFWRAIHVNFNFFKLIFHFFFQVNFH